uniref:Uncharacterized protein n=1 Tax=Globodera rostochiensis TaxID=31243 RepID=A0A914H2W8_GLORO
MHLLEMIFKVLPSSLSPFLLLLFLALLFDLSLCQPTSQQKSIQELLNATPLLPSAEQHDSLGDPFQQQRWLSVRPFQEYRRPQTDELGLLLQYLDNKRNAPSMLTETNGGGGQSSNGSPLGTMRFGKRKFNSPLGTMRFGKRGHNNAPFGTMRFG